MPSDCRTKMTTTKIMTTTAATTKAVRMTNNGRKNGIGDINEARKMEQVLALVDHGRNYSKMIVFLAIVDILMGMVVLGSWIIMIFILLLIFTADRDRCQRDEEENFDQDHRIDRAHLETSTIVLYIIQPIFYTMSLLTAMFMAHAIQKILVLVLMIWEVYVMCHDYLSYQDHVHLIHFGYYLSTLLDTSPDIIALDLVGGVKRAGKMRKYFETRMLTWTIQVLMNAIQVFAFIFTLRLLRNPKSDNSIDCVSRVDGDSKMFQNVLSKRPNIQKSLVSVTLLMFLTVLSLLFKVVSPMKILRWGHDHDHNHVPVHLIASVVDTFFQFLAIFFLVNLKRRSVYLDAYSQSFWQAGLDEAMEA